MLHAFEFAFEFEQPSSSFRRLWSESRFGVRGSGFRVWGLRFGVWGLGFGVWGVRYGVWVLLFYQNVDVQTQLWLIASPKQGTRTFSVDDSFSEGQILALQISNVSRDNDGEGAL